MEKRAIGIEKRFQEYELTVSSDIPKAKKWMYKSSEILICRMPSENRMLGKKAESSEYLKIKQVIKRDILNTGDDVKVEENPHYTFDNLSDVTDIRHSAKN